MNAKEKAFFGALALIPTVLTYVEYQEGGILGAAFPALFAAGFGYVALFGKIAEEGDPLPEAPKFLESRKLDDVPRWLRWIGRIGLAIGSFFGKVVIAISLALHPDFAGAVLSHGGRIPYLFHFAFFLLGVSASRNPIGTWGAASRRRDRWHSSAVDRDRGSNRVTRVGWMSLLRAAVAYAFATALFRYGPGMLPLGRSQLYWLACGFTVILAWRVPTRELIAQAGEPEARSEINRPAA